MVEIKNPGKTGCGHFVVRRIPCSPLKDTWTGRRWRFGSFPFFNGETIQQTLTLPSYRLFMLI